VKGNTPYILLLGLRKDDRIVITYLSSHVFGEPLPMGRRPIGSVLRRWRRGPECLSECAYQGKEPHLEIRYRLRCTLGIAYGTLRILQNTMIVLTKIRYVFGTGAACRRVLCIIGCWLLLFLNFMSKLRSSVHGTIIDTHSPPLQMEETSNCDQSIQSLPNIFALGAVF
jgi:hypothetical protein